jgi:predicted transcriptional regulator
MHTDESSLSSLLRQLAIQAQSILDLTHSGNKLLFSRHTFEEFTILVFPVMGRQTLAVALSSRNPSAGAFAKVVKLLKTIEEDSAIDFREVKDSYHLARRENFHLTASRRATSMLQGSSSSSSSSSNSFDSNYSTFDGRAKANEAHIENNNGNPGRDDEVRRFSVCNTSQSSCYQSAAIVETPRRGRKRFVRSQRMIVKAILEACRVPSPQHVIMMKAKLGYETFWMHVGTMLAQGLLKEEKDDQRRSIYSITDIGLASLRQLPEV